MKVSENIMTAHVKAGAIPDPHSYPEAALKVLRGHYKVMEHAARSIELSNDENATSEIMTGGWKSDKNPRFPSKETENDRF